MRRLGRILVVAGLATSLLAVQVLPALGNPDLVVQDLADEGGPTPEDLANALVGPDVTVSNVSYTGAGAASGTFSGGTGIVGFESGILLTSGLADNVIGPNNQTGVTGNNGTAGDSDLNTLSGFTTFDAAVLEFDFEIAADAISFNYVFASDEYNEFVNTSFNDVFGFFVNGVNGSGVNCATVNGDPVSVNTINNGNGGEEGNATPSHPELYINNDPVNPDADGTVAAEDLLDTEMDGLTVVLTCDASVVPAPAVNHIKLAIADASDSSLDSAVFLEEGSFTSADTTVCEAGQDCQATDSNDDATATVECDAGQATECGTITLTVDDEPSATACSGPCEVSGFIDVQAAADSTVEEKTNTFLLLTLDTDPGVLGAPGQVQFFFDGEQLAKCRPGGDINDPDSPRPNTTPCIYRSTSPDVDDSNHVEILFRLIDLDTDPPWGAK